MKFFYHLFIRFYPFIAKLISPQNEKAKLWVAGRQAIFDKLAKAFAGNTSQVVWMHCASLGEFEQGLPIIEHLRSKKNNVRFLITFFSPSGYEVKKDYQGADWVFYLPMDSAKNAKQFYNIVQPSLVLFIKYEFWFYYLQEAKQRQIPLLLVSGIFRESQPFFKWYGSFYRDMLSCFTHLFLQNQASAALLATIEFKDNVSVSGDTRFDRVKEIADHFTPNKLIENFISNSNVIVAGSTWLEDDKELQHFANNHPELKFIIAPHDVQQSRIEECMGLYKNAVLFSKLTVDSWQLVEQPVTSNILLIDNIGLLSKLYNYATLCFVGGGFGNDGVHNVLEAAVYGKPIIFGPVYEKYIEAEELIEAGGAFSEDNALDLEYTFNNLLSNETTYAKTCTNASNYVAGKIGATDEIVGYINSNQFLNLS